MTNNNFFDFNKYLKFTSENPNDPAYYYSTIGLFIIIMIILNISNYLFKIKNNENNDDDDDNNSENLNLNKNQKILKYKWLSAFLFSKASTWAKSPYLFTLYLKYHKFTVSEIGVLYIIDALCALISTPIFGTLADKYGRRLFSSLYSVFVIINLSLRLTRNKFLAYFAQILTGCGSTLITTPFESWIVYESNELFKFDKNNLDKYLKDIFRSQALYDSYSSILTSVITAILYTFLGINAPLIFAICLAGIGFIIITFTWVENKPNSEDKQHNYKSFFEACKELKKRDVLSVGIIEGLWYACLQLYIFIWTPILLFTNNNNKINIGFIFLAFVIQSINGTLIFELLVTHLHLGNYIAYSFILILVFIVFFIIYNFNTFYLRLIVFSFMNFSGGFFLPLNSIVKSRIIIEKYRATLMNIYKIPVNVYFIGSIIFLKFIKPITVIEICIYLIGIAVFISFTLLLFPVNHYIYKEYNYQIKEINEEELEKIKEK
jgi:predicted MFS family arabinose efflux permease